MSEQTLIIAKTPQRKLSGLIEIELAKKMADKTNWRKMLKGEVEAVDLLTHRRQVFEWIPKDLKKYFLENEPVMDLHYPVQSVPSKIVSHNLDKVPAFTDVLSGIKGQYLICRERVINLRKYAGYHVEFDIGG